MRKIFLLTFVIINLTVFSQEIQIDTVYFDLERDPDFVSKIPRAIDLTGTNHEIVEEINATLLNFFMIESFDVTEEQDFRWWNMNFSTEVISDYLLISISGEFLGVHAVPVDEDLYFDIETGAKMDEKIVKYNSLLKLDSFFEFMNNFCLPGCGEAMLEAQNCADLDYIYCDCYDLEFYINENSVDFVLTGDCVPHYAQACDPGGYIMNVKADSLKPYLNDFGQYVIFDSGYKNFTKLERQIFGIEKSKDISPYYFIDGKIDGKYAFSMGLELSKPENIARGYYFYHSQKKHISLSGAYEENRIRLTETVNNKVTGTFYFYFFNEYSEGCYHLADGMYLSAVWVNPKTSEEYVVNIDMVKFNK
jgi:hypothetical protein